MLKPKDIQSKEFEIKIRGYDRDEVDDFLDEIINDMSVLYKDNTELSARVKQLSEELSVLKAREAESAKTLELTKYQCEEMKKNAQIEASEIIKKARGDSEDLFRNLESTKRRMKEICTEILDKVNNI